MDKIIHVPDLNLVPKNWSNNVIIPKVFKRIIKYGMTILLVSAGVIALLSFVSYFSQSYKDGLLADINQVHNDASRFLNKHHFLQEHIKELELLADWRAKINISEQFAALSSFFVDKNAFLMDVIFRSSLIYVPDKLLADIRANFERVTRTKIDALNVVGIWELSLMMPISELNVAAARNNAISALQNGISSSFSNTDFNATLLSFENMSRDFDKFNFIIVICERRGGQ